MPPLPCVPLYHFIWMIHVHLIVSLFHTLYDNYIPMSRAPISWRVYLRYACSVNSVLLQRRIPFSEAQHIFQTQFLSLLGLYLDMSYLPTTENPPTISGASVYRLCQKEPI